MFPIEFDAVKGMIELADWKRGSDGADKKWVALFVEFGWIELYGEGGMKFKIIIGMRVFIFRVVKKMGDERFVYFDGKF